MDDIRDIVKKVIGSLSSQKPQQQEEIQEYFKIILNNGEVRHAKITGLKKGTLSVSVDSPAWLYQFNLKKKSLLDKVQKEFPEIRAISFRVGNVV